MARIARLGKMLNQCSFNITSLAVCLFHTPKTGCCVFHQLIGASSTKARSKNFSPFFLLFRAIKEETYLLVIWSWLPKAGPQPRRLPILFFPSSSLSFLIYFCKFLLFWKEKVKKLWKTRKTRKRINKAHAIRILCKCN